MTKDDRIDIKKEAKDFIFWIGVIENYIKENTYMRPKLIWDSGGVGSFRVEILYNDASIYSGTIDYLRSFCKKNKIKYNFELVSDRVYKVIFYNDI